MRRSLRPKAVVAAMLGAGLLSAGCGGAAERPISPMPSVSALVLPSASGAVLDRGAAARRYLEIVNPHNMAMNELFALQDSQGSWEEEQQVVRKLFEVDDVEIRELAGTAWPSDVRPLVDRLVQVKVAQRQAVSDAVNATTRAEYLRLSNLAFADPECIEANAVRVALGLGVAGGDCPTAR